ncbi:MAG TPA: hypothetical protein VJT73_17810 [Polyangiaceae bacterium]|nr:hypothetical protein [Polyangiaceae bacterium]
MQPARLRLGQLLVDANIVSAEQLEQVLTLQKSDGRKLGTLLVESGLVTETRLTQILSQQLSVPWISLYHIDFSRELLSLVPREVAERFSLVPIYVRPVRGQGDTLYVAMEDPMNEDALRACSASSGLPTRAMISAPSDIKKALRLYYGAAPTAPPPPRAAATNGRKPSAPVATPADHHGPEAAAPEPPRVEQATDLHASPIEESALERVSVPFAVDEPASAKHAALAPPSDDTPVLEVREIEMPRGNAKKRAQLKLTLLDGTTIKLPQTTQRRRANAAPAEPTSPDDFTAADLLAALRAAAHGADAADVLGENLRWEKMMAALLSLLMKKHLVLERELIDELKKI